MPCSLDAAFAALGVDPAAEAVQIVAAARITPPEPFAPLLPFVATRPLLVCGLDKQTLLQRVQATLLTTYPNEHTVRLVTQGKVTSSTLADLGQAKHALDLCAYLPAQPVLAAVRSFDALREITARLRAPDGCPWELGDLMMQVMIHSQVAVEAGEFDVGDVLAGISSKLMRRHPHVFGDVQVSGAQEVLRNWQSIKQAEKKPNGDEPPPSLLGGVPKQLPALAYAQAMQERAGRVGFMRPTPQTVEQVSTALSILREAKTEDARLAAYGDLLFSLALMGRGMGIVAEDALRETNRRYRQRFMAVEAICRAQGLEMSELSEEERIRLWREAQEAAT
jgi:tetrapyrrole methylase family protein/MazG family protein